MDDSIAILIDCWESTAVENKQRNANILDFINQSSFIKTVVLASYHTYPEYNTDIVWYKNHAELFNSHNTPRKIQHLNLVYSHHPTTPFFLGKRLPLNKTESSILNFVNSKKFQIAMHWTWELEYYLTLNPNIKNVFLLGGSWSACVTDRPLGLLTLLEIENINILTQILCISDLTKSLQLPLQEPWKLKHNNIYYYETNI